MGPTTVLPGVWADAAHWSLTLLSLDTDRLNNLSSHRETTTNHVKPVHEKKLINLTFERTLPTLTILESFKPRK